MLDFKIPFLKDLKGIKNIYFIGICGTAMASTAILMKEKGFNVSGSDSNVYPPMSDFLKESGVEFFSPYSIKNLKPHPDLVVIGNAVGRGNVEVEYVLNNKIPFLSMAELIGKGLIFGKESIVVAGTHGKTTTTSMVAWLLESIGENPSFLIGGISKNFKSSARSGDGNFFVIEGDEYDTAFFDKKPKFMHYFPDYLILNSVEYDHADIYSDFSKIVDEFKNLVKLVPERGFITYCGDNETCCEVIESSFCECESFGLKKDNDWYPENIKFKRGNIEYELFYKGNFIGKISLNMFGEHNVLNSLAAISILNRLGFSFNAIAGGLERFLGVKRRMDLIYKNDKVIIYEDFAHHPTAVYETLKGVRKSFPKDKVIAIFEPRSWSCRMNVHQGKFVKGFNFADVIIFYKVYQAEKIPEEKRFKPQKEIEYLKKIGKECYYFKDTEKIVKFLKENEEDGFVAVIMSNGGFDGLYEKIRHSFIN